MARDGYMDVMINTEHRVAAPAAPKLERCAWFDLNRDGKIDSVSTVFGGDAYLVGEDLGTRPARGSALPTPDLTRPVAASQPSAQPAAATIERAHASYRANSR